MQSNRVVQLDKAVQSNNVDIADPSLSGSHSSVSLWDRVKPLLLKCSRPARYIDSEFGAIHKPDASYRFTLIYPDVYEVGLANQGLTILYRVLNDLDDICAERSYLPWIDMVQEMRENDIPLFSLESFEPVRCSQAVGFTLQHELCYTNIVEALDLAGIKILAKDRTEDDPLIIAGGPVAYNCEPIAELFDVVMIGEGEHSIVEVVQTHKKALEDGCSREEILSSLAQIDGIYIPLFYEADSKGDPLNPRMVPNRDGVKGVVTKRVLTDFDSQSPQAIPIVPFADLVHDRISVEILRGCSRGCRFCQAGMIYRPVRERSSDSVISCAIDGLGKTGYEEVSLASLSSTDHSQIEEILRRLDQAVDGRAISVSLPSQRLDSFGVKMAELVSRGKKSGLTFAPEAGTQRLRDIINKNVTEQDLLSAIEAAFELGWRRVKLYFMLGLPFETDEDVEGIVHLANKAYAKAKDSVDDNQRANVRMTISCSIFEPKPQTPFQWCGQISIEEALRKVDIIRNSGLHKGIDFNWHDPQASMIEGAFARGGRYLLPVVLKAWEMGCKFDAWSEQFDFDKWLEAADVCGIDLQQIASREIDVGSDLLWNHISAGVSEKYLAKELEKAREAATTADCTFEKCTGCGVCPSLGVDLCLGAKRV